MQSDMFDPPKFEIDHELVRIGTTTAFAKLKEIRGRDIHNTIDEAWIAALVHGWQAMCDRVRERST